MAWQSSDLDALDAAIAKGVLIVRYKDSEIRYHTLDEMMRLRRQMRRELGASKKKRFRTPFFSKDV